MDTITADEQATEFFGRRRNRQEIRELMRELRSHELREAHREAKAQKFDAGLDARRAEWQEIQRAAVARALTSSLLDDAARAMLPVPEIKAQHAPHTVGAHERAARRFFARVEGQNLYAREETRHQQHQKRRRVNEQTARWRTAISGTAYVAWVTAPVDPITEAEYHAISTKHPHTIRAIATEQKERNHRYTGMRIQPVGGMTLDRAYDIAQAALEAIENGTVPPQIRPPRT